MDKAHQTRYLVFVVPLAQPKASFQLLLNIYYHSVSCLLGLLVTIYMFEFSSFFGMKIFDIKSKISESLFMMNNEVKN